MRMIAILRSTGCVPRKLRMAMVGAVFNDSLGLDRSFPSATYPLSGPVSYKAHYEDEKIPSLFSSFITHPIMPAMLTILPPEIIEQILQLLDPLDVAMFSQACKDFYNLVYHNRDRHLWRALYLAQPFDDPRLSLTPRLHRILPEDIDWKGSLQAIIRARTVLTDPSKCRPGERKDILRTLIQLLRGAAPAQSFEGRNLSENLVWLVAMLRDGVFLNEVVPCGSTPDLEEVQMRAYLLTHLGLTPSDATNGNKAAALAFVYDMRNYRYDSSFGPFMSDGSGRINWVHVHAIHRTIAMHLVDLREGEPFVFPLIPISMPYCQGVIPPGLDLDDKGCDWAGIEGLWHCTFCFIDHRDLLRKCFLSYPRFWWSRSDPSSCR